MRWVAGVQQEPLRGGEGGGGGAAAHLSAETGDRFTDSHEISEAPMKPGEGEGCVSFLPTRRPVRLAT